MILGCVCGGWIEILLTAGGCTFFVSIYGFLGRVCKKIGCMCKCHSPTKNKDEKGVCGLSEAMRTKYRGTPHHPPEN